MPLYEITTKGEEKKRLVEADSQAAAIRHCAKTMFETRLVSSPSEAAKLVGGGVEVEQAATE